jgi:hypothetical protein
MTTPPSGPGQPPPPPEHIQPPSTPKMAKSDDPRAAFLLSSPFAKMFEGTGAQPTAKEMHAIINGILKQQINEIKRSDAGWKKAMKKLKEAIEGND